MDRATFSEAVKDSLSPSRLRDYKEADTDYLNAVSKYLWNIELCKSLYLPLQYFEVGLRNALHKSMVDYWQSDDWLFSGRIIVGDNEIDAVDNAEQDLLSTQKWSADRNNDINDLVASLHLGFWTALFGSRYEKTVYIPSLSRGLKGIPRDRNDRKILYKRFDDHRFLRNRIFHHEPIWHWRDLPRRHQNMIEDIHCLYPVQGKLVAITDQFPQVHAEGWKKYRTLIADGILSTTPPTPTS